MCCWFSVASGLLFNHFLNYEYRVQIYGAVIMKNTMCLGIFLAVVYFRQLVWDFSAEVAVILFATVVMGTVAAARTTFPLWMAFIALALYPLSIALIAFLDYFCGWH